MSAELLEQVLEASSAPKIISVNNDMSTINWVKGISDPGEMIACGAYQELRRHAEEADEAYQARITVLMQQLPADVRDKIMVTMTAAAIKRASLDDSTGKIALMVAGKLPWHGLGVQIDKACSAAEAIKLASLDWLVKKVQQYYLDDTQTQRVAEGMYALYRNDTNAFLGTVGKNYQPIQNESSFAFLDSVIGEFGARYESAGAIFGGEEVFMTVHLPKQAFTLNGVDRNEAYALFTNPHKIGAAKCLPTDVRVECANTKRLAVANAKGKGISVRHTGNLQAKIKSAQEALGIAVQGFEDYKQAAEVLNSKKLEFTPYARDVLDAALDITQAQMSLGADALAAATGVTQAKMDAEVKLWQSKIDRREKILEDVIERYESTHCNIGGMAGTAWAAYNAFSEHTDHARVGKQAQNKEIRDSRRFTSVLVGAGDDMKQIAFEKALAV
jgi:phage/plasmid-like protein (TIGR03299 family)